MLQQLLNKAFLQIFRALSPSITLRIKTTPIFKDFFLSFSLKQFHEWFYSSKIRKSAENLKTIGYLRQFLNIFSGGEPQFWVSATTTTFRLNRRIYPKIAWDLLFYAKHQVKIGLKSPESGLFCVTELICGIFISVQMRT